MIYNSLVTGEIKYNFLDSTTLFMIKSFFDNREALHKHITEKVGHTSFFSLPHPQTTRTSLQFTSEPGEYHHVKESLNLIISLLNSLEITGITVDITHYEEDEPHTITHYKYENKKILSSPATITFNDYT